MMVAFCCSVGCLQLTSFDNGRINCSLGDDEVPSPEDTCSFTCNTGYELTGSDTRTCQSNGTWNGSDAICIRGMYISNTDCHTYMHCLKIMSKIEMLWV